MCYCGAQIHVSHDLLRSINRLVVVVIVVVLIVLVVVEPRSDTSLDCVSYRPVVTLRSEKPWKCRGITLCL